MNVINIQNVSKTYPAGRKKANNNISLELKKGEILCIAGENGAGKTTLMKILMGLEKQDEGEVRINGNIGMVHQHFMLFDEYTAAQNIVMGNEPKKWGPFLDNKKANEVSDKIITDNNFSINSTSKIKNLTLGERQQVEICRILFRNSDIIILDEPTSILTENETQSLFKTLKTLSGSGKSIILITHKLKEIKRIGDRVAVLRKGELVGVRDAAKIDENEIANMMIGDKNFDFTIKREIIASSETNEPLEARTEGSTPGVPLAKLPAVPVIEFKNVTVRRKGQNWSLLEDISFNVKEGEILGFAGVGGNGLGVIEAVMGGFLHPASGKIMHKGKDISRLSIRALRNQGLSFVPADRLRVGSAREATIEENVLIGNYKTRFPNGILSWLKKHNILFNSVKDKAATLSGGNLQKLIMARETDSIKDYIVFSEPTWGLDINSTSFFHEKILELRKNGTAIILISTNLDEILSLSDRIIVMYRGKVTCEINNDGSENVRECVGKSMQGLGK